VYDPRRAPFSDVTATQDVGVGVVETPGLAAGEAVTGTVLVMILVGWTAGLDGALTRPAKNPAPVRATRTAASALSHAGPSSPIRPSRVAALALPAVPVHVLPGA